MDVITYSLRGGQKRSDAYYHTAAVFTDSVLAEADHRVQPLVEAFRADAQKAGREPSRTAPEYILELLTLGVLWRVYAGDALGLAGVPRRALTCLAHARQRGGCLKAGADVLRGALAALFLSRRGHGLAEIPSPTLDHLDRLLGWLEATGDFSEAVKRLRAWRDFLASQLPEAAAESLAQAIALATWFEACSEAVLGCYTSHVERFLAGPYRKYRGREDFIFCGRRRVEYHLAMVAIEILNRAFRAAFLATARKVVLVPPCMKARSDDECQARATPLGARCAACTPGCRVHQLTRLGEKHGFGVLMLPDELAVYSGATARPGGSDDVGIVGVSCVLTNCAGGWETRDLGIPAQGVPLDYCGCRYHWHKDGIPTDINFDHLLEVLEVKLDGPSSVEGEEV
jgi:uncharacterized protein